MVNDSKYNTFLIRLNELGLSKYVFHNFNLAKESGFSHSIVLATDDSKTEFDIYLTAIRDDQFGEYASWVYQEFQDDDELFGAVLRAVENIYTQSSDESKTIKLEGTYTFYFTPY